MPFFIPDNDDPRLKQLLAHVDQIMDVLNKKDLFFNSELEAKVQAQEKAVSKLVYELYGLHPVEQQLIEDMLEYGIGFFNWSKLKSRKPQDVKAVKRPTLEMLEIYIQIFVRAVTTFLQIKNQTLNAIVYQNGTPLTVVSFALVDLNKAEPVRVITQSNAMRSKLRELDEMLLDRKTPSMYIRRHVRIYDGDQVSLVRPSERRFWTQSQARADADAFLAELSS